jgi:hypothetical protein
MKHKSVQVVGYQFDALPGHVRVAVRGTGNTLRIALQRAIGNLFRDPKLRRKRIDSFKLSVVVITERELPTGSEQALDPDRHDKNVCRYRHEGGAA